MEKALYIVTEGHAKHTDISEYLTMELDRDLQVAVWASDERGALIVADSYDAGLVGYGNINVGDGTTIAAVVAPE